MPYIVYIDGLMHKHQMRGYVLHSASGLDKEQFKQELITCIDFDRISHQIMKEFVLESANEN